MLDEIKDVIHQLCTKGIGGFIVAYSIYLATVAAGQSNATAQALFDYQIALWVWPPMIWIGLGFVILWAVAYGWSRPRVKRLERLKAKIAVQSVTVPPRPSPHLIAQAHDASMGQTASSPIVGTLDAQEDDDTLSASGAVGIQGLYVGMIIVAAGALKRDLQLEIAVRGFNGSNERLVIGEIEGRIRAGTGNMRDVDELSPLAVRETIRSEPNSEFMLVLYQSVSSAQAKQFMAAFTEGASNHVSLDLRGLTIRAACEGNIKCWARLPLWDGVNLRRRDDIVSNRNTILSVGVAEEAKATASCDASITRNGKTID